MPDPTERATFERCQLDHGEREAHREVYDLHRDLLRFRREDPALGATASGLDGAVLAAEALALRFFEASGHDRLLVVNLGSDLLLTPSPEPLLAPPKGTVWVARWSSEDPRYGGGGFGDLPPDRPWTIPGHSAVLLAGAASR